MRKTLKIDYSGNRLMAVAEDLFNRERYIEALRILNKNATINGNDENTYFLYAEIFDELDLEEKAIHYLYNSLDYLGDAEYAADQDPSECYKGLAVCYMELGDRKACSYYYRLYLSCEREQSDTDDDSMDDVEDFVSGADDSSKAKSPLRFVYPPEIADFSDVMDLGIRYVMNDQPARAMQEFEKIPKGNELHYSACINIATCLVLLDRYNDAERVCRYVLDAEPDSLLATIMLSSVRMEQGKTEEARSLARKVLGMEIDNADTLNKECMLLCQTGLHKEAYECFTRLMEEFNVYKLQTLYFRAVAAYNAGMGQECIDAINLLLDIFPVAVTAIYMQGYMKSEITNGTYNPLPYVYSLPDNITAGYLSILIAYMSMSATQAREAYRKEDLAEAILWCFDGEYEEDKEKVQEIALPLAVNVGEYDLVRDYLLERRVSNDIKIDTLVTLAMRNVDEQYGVVISDMIYHVRFRKLTIGRKARKHFIAAYATVCAKFSFLDELLGDKLAPAVEKVYKVMESKGRLDRCEDENALSMVIYMVSGMKLADLPNEIMLSMLETTKEDVANLTAGIVFK